MLRAIQRHSFSHRPFIHQFAKRNLATVAKDLENAYDVVIIGGGVAGVSLACSLGKKKNPTMQHHRIALVEAMDLSKVKKWEPKQDNYSNRVVSLTPGSMGFFKKIGVANHMHLDRANGYRDMQVWDGVTDARIHLDSALLKNYGVDKGIEEDTIAYIVENINIQSAALKRLDECIQQGAQVDLIEQVKVDGIERYLEENEKKKGHEHVKQDENSAGLDLEDWPSVHLDNGRTLKARLLIGADGINSPVRKFAYIDSLGWDYDAHGVVATLKLDPERPNDTAWQRFLPTGPIALLPLSENYASLVWSTKPAIAKALKNVSSKDFCSFINAAYRMSNVDLKYLYKQINPTTFETACDIQEEYLWREDVAKKAL
ncbi:MAG: hypothetical protein EXX96DRAFT_450557, partial [Benjaminiella poitrasii]